MVSRRALHHRRPSLSLSLVPPRQSGSVALFLLPLPYLDAARRSSWSGHDTRRGNGGAALTLSRHGVALEEEESDGESCLR
jgi:hypothetical protein